MKWLIGLLILLAAIAVLVPVAIHSIQNRDFKRQIEGKRPLREADETMPTCQDTPPDPALEAEKERMIASNRLNMMGPK